MAKAPSKARTPWTRADEKTLSQLVKQNSPTREVALKLGRTEESIRSKAKDLGVTRKPTKQSPSTKRKGR